MRCAIYWKPRVKRTLRATHRSAAPGTSRCWPQHGQFYRLFVARGQGFNDDVYAASEMMSSIESFSITGFMSALPAPARMPARKS